jgi:hypothetical protein
MTAAGRRGLRWTLRARSRDLPFEEAVVALQIDLRRGLIGNRGPLGRHRRLHANEARDLARIQEGDERRLDLHLQRARSEVQDPQFSAEDCFLSCLLLRPLLGFGGVCLCLATCLFDHGQDCVHRTASHINENALGLRHVKSEARSQHPDARERIHAVLGKGCATGVTWGLEAPRSPEFVGCHLFTEP